MNLNYGFKKCNVKSLTINKFLEYCIALFDIFFNSKTLLYYLKIN